MQKLFSVFGFAVFGLIVLSFVSAYNNDFGEVCVEEPLHVVEKSYARQLEIASENLRVMLDEGLGVGSKHCASSPVALAKAGQTPLHCVVQTQENSRHQHKFIVDLIRKGADVNARDNLGDTPLHKTASVNADKFLALLIREGANVDARNDVGNTPLHLAVISDADKAANGLIRAGADVNACEIGGRRSLHMVAKNDSAKSAARLIRAGADINACSRYYGTPLYYAAQHDAKNVAKLLTQMGAKPRC